MITGEISLKDILNDELKMQVFSLLQEKDILPKLSDRLKNQYKLKKKYLLGQIKRLRKSLVNLPETLY